MVTPLSYYGLVETFPAMGCAVCNLLLRDADRFLDSLLYEYVNDPDSHRTFRARRGLCNEHAWHLTRYTGHSLSIAVLYHAAVDEVLTIMAEEAVESVALSASMRRRAGNGPFGMSALADRLESAGPCAACRLLADAEVRYLRTFGQYISDSRLEDAYRVSDGLCLPHFRLLLRQALPVENLRKIITIQRAIWAQLKTDLAEFRSKTNVNRRDETMGAEGDSWRRAIGRMAGEKGVFGPDPRTT